MTFRNSSRLSVRPTKIISSTHFVFSNAAMVCAITGLPLTSAKSLSKPIRSLEPAATIIALSIAKIENAQRSTSNAQRRSQNCLIRYSALDVERSAFSSSELFLHFRAERLAIRAAGNFCLQRFHDCAHLLFRSRANFRNGFAHELGKLIGTHCLR